MVAEVQWTQHLHNNQLRIGQSADNMYLAVIFEILLIAVGHCNEIELSFLMR